MSRGRAARAGLAGLCLIGSSLLLAACHRPRPVPARPALFVVADADTTIWLFGTIHLLPADVDWRDAAIDDAVRQADTLVTEISDADLRDGGDAFAAAARDDRLPPALSRVPPDRRAALAQAIADAGLTIAQADRLKSWALATTIATAPARARAADRAPGPEAVLGRAFRDAGKPQRAFESLRGQLALFDGLAEEDQRALLVAALDDLADPARGYAATLSAWETGDTARIAAALAPTFAGHPRLTDALLIDRNRRWSAWLARRMRAPGKIMVVVGAGHLAGPQSLVAMLRAQGMTVRRVQ